MISYEQILKESNESVAGTKKKGQDAINASYDSKKKIYNDQYNTAIKDTNVAYEDLYQKNAVQKMINEKEIAEKNASLGLTDSGLNRTQQAAVQLGYANQKGKLDIAKQNALDTLSQNLAVSVANIEGDRKNALAEWDYKIDTQAQSNAIERYNTLVDAETKKYEANVAAQAKEKELKAKQSVYLFRGASDIAGKVLYYNSETGKTEEIPQYINPYTGEDNRLKYQKEYNDANIGFMPMAEGTDGYQPKGLKSEGGAFMRKETKDGGVVTCDLYGNGRFLPVWESPRGNNFVWDDRENRYVNVNKKINMSSNK